MTETKLIPLEKAFTYVFEFTKEATDPEKRIVEGYATTEALDRMGEIVSLDAVKSAIEEYRSFPVIYADHKPPPVAEATNLDFDEKGLIVKSKFYEDTQAANEAWALTRQGGYRAYSIGGYVKEVETEYSKEHGEQVTRITKLSIAEISLTGAPANPECLLSTIAKSLSPDSKKKALEREDTTMVNEPDKDKDKGKTPETSPLEEKFESFSKEVTGELGKLTAILKELKPPEKKGEDTKETLTPENAQLAKALAPEIAKLLGLKYEPEPVRSATQEAPPSTPPADATPTKEPMTLSRMIAQGKGQPVNLEEIRK